MPVTAFRGCRVQRSENVGGGCLAFLMTSEVELEDSSLYADDYAWHDFLTERDFRPEDLWEFDCELWSPGVGSTPSEGPSHAQPESGGQTPGRPEAQLQPSMRVWESAPPTHSAATGTDTDHANGFGLGSPDPAGLCGRVVLTGLEALDNSDTADALKKLAGLRSWIDAIEARIVAALADRTRDEVLHRFPSGNRAEDMAQSVAASEVAFTLNIPERTAHRLVEESVQLTAKHSATLEALEAGSISRRHAILIADESLGMPPNAVPLFERALLDQAQGMTVAKLARRARRLREEHHPQTLRFRKVKAEAERHVELQPDDDGMAWLHVYLPAEQACGIYQRLTSTARKVKTPDEPRTLTQLRADVFVDLLTHDCTTNEHSAWRGITAHVNVTVPVLALLDVLGEDTGVPEDDSAGVHETPGGRAGGNMDPHGLNQFAELEGYGPIDTATAARLAAHAPSFTRILTHPVTGSVLDVGRETYRPPKHLQDWVRARDRTCRHPGCNRAAVACEIDHTVPWARGGTTSHFNLACLCPKHHLYKSEGVFRYRQPEPGKIVVRSRAGTERTSTPDPPFGSAMEGEAVSS